MSMFCTAFSASARSAVASSSRGFHSTPAAFKVTEKVVEVADKVCFFLTAQSGAEFSSSGFQVNKKVGQTLASAIEKGEEATEKTKETLGEYMLCCRVPRASLTSCVTLVGTAKDKASEASSVASQKANQVCPQWS